MHIGRRATLRSAVASVAVTVLAALLPGIAAAAASPGLAVWPAGKFYSVAADSESDVWIAGDRFVNGHQRAWIEHWDGSSWTLQQLPSGGGPASQEQLNSVAVGSPSDVWAVGTIESPQGSHLKTLVLHWDGAGWTRLASPNPGATGDNQLTGVAETAAGVRVVGTFASGRGSYHFFALRWDGTALVRDHAAPNTRGGFTSISSDGGTGAWAAGGTPRHQYTSHFDGTTWTPTPLPAGEAKYAGLNAVAATTPSDAWAVGQAEGGSTTFAEHWDGTSWTPSKMPESPNAALLAVAPVSDSDVWAVGDTDTGPLAEHWDGTTWTIADLPNPVKLPIQQLTGVTFTASNDGWAVGISIGQEGPARGAVLHWDGTNWSIVRPR